MLNREGIGLGCTLTCQRTLYAGIALLVKHFLNYSCGQSGGERLDRAGRASTRILFLGARSTRNCSGWRIRGNAATEVPSPDEHQEQDSGQSDTEAAGPARGPKPARQAQAHPALSSVPLAPDMSLRGEFTARLGRRRTQWGGGFQGHWCPAPPTHCPPQSECSQRRESTVNPSTNSGERMKLLPSRNLDSFRPRRLSEIGRAR